MAKWSFALLVLLSTGVQANGLSPQSDGCAVLNEIIYEEVVAAGWGITRADLVSSNFNEPNVVVCSHTTQMASKAFASAMGRIGGGVSWDDGFGQDFDTCRSGFIEICIPRDQGTPPVLQSAGGLSVHDTWLRISHTVARAMPEGSATDRSVFSEESLRLAVRAALR